MNSPERHDLIVTGGGPAGLAAALTAESERIDTIVLEASKFGGQAGTSSMIENYPGFPGGISGKELMSRIMDQALGFDTEFIAPIRATNVESAEDGLVVSTDSSEQYLGRAVLLSTGVEPRILRARNLAAYLGRGASYGSPNLSIDYTDSDSLVIGGANSAGQAAKHLASFEGSNVHLLVRSGSIEDKMSGYLVDQISEKENIHIHTETELVGVDGNGCLEYATVKHGNDTERMKAKNLFVMIGSEPKTRWLPTEVARDERGFVVAGVDIPDEFRGNFVELTKGRPPSEHETSLPGLFVAGDVRSGTRKRVAAAIGDGTTVVPEIHMHNDN